MACFLNKDFSSELLLTVACLDFCLLGSYLIVVLRRSDFAFPSFSQWYKKKGNWREDIAGAREIERACVSLCVIIYPACKVGMISVNEVIPTFVTLKQILRLWRKMSPVLSPYCEPLDLNRASHLSWNWIILSE